MERQPKLYEIGEFTLDERSVAHDAANGRSWIAEHAGALF